MKLRATSSIAVLLLALSALPQALPKARLKPLSFELGQLDIRTAELPVTIPRYDLPANRIIFWQKDIHLVVDGDIDTKSCIARVNGLLDPDIQVPLGAKLTITVINFAHAPVRFEFHDQPPPFPPEGSPGLSHTPWDRFRRIGAVQYPALPGTWAAPAGTVFDVVMTYLAQGTGVIYYGGQFSWRGDYGRIIVVP